MNFVHQIPQQYTPSELLTVGSAAVGACFRECCEKHTQLPHWPNTSPHILSAVFKSPSTARTTNGSVRSDLFTVHQRANVSLLRARSHLRIVSVRGVNSKPDLDRVPVLFFTGWWAEWGQQFHCSLSSGWVWLISGWKRQNNQNRKWKSEQKHKCHCSQSCPWVWGSVAGLLLCRWWESRTQCRWRQKGRCWQGEVLAHLARVPPCLYLHKRTGNHWLLLLWQAKKKEPKATEEGNLSSALAGTCSALAHRSSYRLLFRV